MMKVIKILYKKVFITGIILVLFTLISCNKPQTFLQTYYEFEADDLEKLPAFELDKSLRFKNNLGFEVVYNADFVTDTEKIQYIQQGGTISILFIPVPTPNAYYFFYDTQLSSFNYGTLKFGYARFPNNIEQAQENAYEEYASDFTIQIYFRQWNANNQHIINIDLSDAFTTLSINGVTYNAVYTTESDNQNTGSQCSRVNKIYYDLYTGLIGYDEIDGTEWRLIN